MRKSFKVILAVEVIALVSYAMYRRSHTEVTLTAPERDGNRTEDTRPASFTPGGYAVASGVLTFSIPQPQTFRIVVDALTIRNARLTGRIGMSAGGQGDFKALLLNHDNFVKWQDGQEYETVYRNNPTAEDTSPAKPEDIDVPIAEPGLYYLVFTGASPGVKSANVDIRLEYDQRVK